MRNGFTLAEILITIGLIGLIAVLTIPQLLKNYQSKVLDTQNKRAQTVLINGFRLIMAKENVNELGDTSVMSCHDRECMKTILSNVFDMIIDINDDSNIIPTEYIFKNKEKHDVWRNNEDIVYTFINNDGMIVGIKATLEGERSLNIIADINGNKGPNRGGQDLCQYLISNSGVILSQCALMSNYSPTSAEDATNPSSPGVGDEPEIEDDMLCNKPPSGWDNCHPLGMLSIFGTGRLTCGLCKKNYKLVVEGKDWANNDYGYCVPKGCK